MPAVEWAKIIYTKKSDFNGRTVVEFFSFNFNLNEFDRRVETWWPSKVQHPIRASA